MSFRRHFAKLLSLLDAIWLKRNNMVGLMDDCDDDVMGLFRRYHSADQQSRPRVRDMSDLGITRERRRKEEEEEEWGEGQ